MCHGKYLTEEIVKDPDIEISKWKLEREQGSFRFAVRISFPVILGAMIFRTIEPMFNAEAVWGWEQVTDILMIGFWTSVGAIPFSFVIWWWRERKYKRHLARFE
ncbi:hypothetical protein K0W37_004576 [Vibrio parahaemolyticus]|nr:hypothetical protein [Vibrio parahaemolyticus]